jgi:hypothetical protein
MKHFKSILSRKGCFPLASYKMISFGTIYPLAERINQYHSEKKITS